MVYGWAELTQAMRVNRWLLPATCVACGTHRTLHRADLNLCRACWAALPINHHGCSRCGVPLSSAQGSLTCGRCLRRPPLYELSYCAFEYAYPIEHLIRRFKYGGALSIAHVLGHLLADYVRQHHDADWPQCMVPMPLHAARYRHRGYNQVIELGRALQAQLGIALRTDIVTRVRDTAEQAGLTRAARRKNLRQAFAVNTASLPKHICLLDDVVTTGSSVSALASVLKRAGVQRIEVWSVARAVLHAGT